ncbi:MAG TPA: DMT family transporter [Novimethylophilus sp.]|jgi:drug/metabolite transporter (DMT)-like permease|uniref:DMT family transporter n=1 Tax=Novimethylophilus sp. TaxID=2137426 RepID=UPI002F3E499A
MKSQRLAILAAFAMTAFAANSLLCRLALKHAQIDAASFTSIRILSGAAMLWLIMRLQGKAKHASGSWISAFALFIYAAAFSLAYASLPAGTGALLLFGAVQTTMIFCGLRSGERLNRRQSTGLAMAISGLAAFMLPGVSTPPLIGAVLMLIAGVAWAIYSLLGKGSSDPLGMTAGNFFRAVPLAIGSSLLLMTRMQMNETGIVLAILSGAIASGMGYAIWYQVVRETRTTSAAIMQLSVPVIAAMGGMVLLGEAVTLRLYISSMAILGGIAMVIMKD